MKRYFFIGLFLFVFTANAYATNWYVRPSGGSGSGTSWTAAWNNMSGIAWGSVACGDTIWVAGGSYSANLSPTKTGCTSMITISRARSDSAACTGSTGWSSSYDSDIQDSGGIYISTANANYYTFSGRTTASGGASGWTMTNTSTGARVINVSASPINHHVFEYINIVGGIGVATVDGGGNDSRAVNYATNASGADYVTFSHVDMAGFCSGIYLNNVDYFTFEYGAIHDERPSDEGPSGCHTDPIFPIIGDHGVIRYSVFHHNDGEGIYFPSFGGAHWDDWKIYGNIFHHINIGYSKAIELENPITNLKIFNNTFYSNWADFMLTGTYQCGSGTEVRNNLVYSSAGLPGCGTQSNNVGASSNPFVNLSGNDFHIVSTIGSGYPRNAGINESTYFTTDMDGTVFGGDGAWDVGAYEYGSTVISVRPSAPHLY